MKKYISIAISVLFLTACAHTNQVLFISPNEQGAYIPPGKDICDTANDFDNFDAPTEKVVYKDEEKGVSFEVPYYPEWGSTRNNYKINPYDMRGDVVMFGKLIPAHPCGWGRAYIFESLPLETESDIRKKLQTEEVVRNLSLVNANGFSYLKYEAEGLCTLPTFHIFGKKYNYRIAPTCGNNTEEEFKFMEEIVTSMKLL